MAVCLAHLHAFNKEVKGHMKTKRLLHLDVILGLVSFSLFKALINQFASLS